MLSQRCVQTTLANAGFTLSELIDVHSTPTIPGNGDLTRPVLAMIGGFSATVVYRILSRLTETVEMLFQGDAVNIITPVPIGI